ncbi:cupin-like domain-containing protein [Ruegeria atlantica]|uniref:cupin-like domain-containing protein n=1 Tax=Ruegeria atlantica TaxID=81569 RepID=UPI00147A0738|nr:cupin-like domain-containing protein [Ruegeria atlantica]
MVHGSVGNIGDPDVFGDKLFFKDTGSFKVDFGKLPFLLHHNFENSDLFSLSRLARAAEQLIQKGRGHRFSAHRAQDKINSGWVSMPREEQVAAAVESIGEQNAWMKITALNEADPAYVEFLNTAIAEIDGLLDHNFKQEVTHAQMTAFISSPGVAAPYHIDHEENFLCQISGEKEVCLYDPLDRENLPDKEIEEFYFGNYDAAKYRDNLKSRGKIFQLKPGVAVHHPSLSAHWVRNGDQPSVSISLVFCTKEIDKRAYIYQSNYLLRRLGLPQSPPGRHPFWDEVKKKSIRAVSKPRPTSFRELIFSGPDNIKAPIRSIQNMFKSVKSN